MAGAGHELTLSFSRDPGKLDERARELGAGASAGTLAEAVDFGEVIVISVPWGVLPQALEQAGSLAGKIVIDTTNQFDALRSPRRRDCGAHFNAARMWGARYTKCFNTLTSAFQAEAAGRHGEKRVVQWLCGDDANAKEVVAGLVEDAGFVPVDLGGTAECSVMEAPRREAPSTVRSTAPPMPALSSTLFRAGRRTIPPTPRYGSAG